MDSMMYQCPVEKSMPCDSYGAHNFCECTPPTKTPTNKYATERPQGWVEYRTARHAGLWYNAGSDLIGASSQVTDSL